MVQTIIVTTDKYNYLLDGYCHLWNKYYPDTNNNLVCGFTPHPLPDNFQFYAMDNPEDYPADKWSNLLIRLLDEVAEDVFYFALADYWLLREVDRRGIQIIYDYMLQFQNVVRFDLTMERLYNAGYPGLSQEDKEKTKGHIVANEFYFGMNTYNTAGHLDLIKSKPYSPYHMSVWGAMWRRDLLKKVLLPDKSGAQIELEDNLSQYGDECLVLGTRQAPLLHGNMLQRGEWCQSETTGLGALKDGDTEALKGLGYL